MDEKISDQQRSPATPELDGNHDARRRTWIALGQAAIDVAAEPNEPKTSLVDTLCNLRHWAEAHGIAYDDASNQAGAHYEQEKQRSKVDGVDVPDHPPQFDADQRQRALELIESLPWGDVEGHLVSMERALQLLMEATTAGFEHWERQGERHFGNDEFNLTEGQIEGMDLDWRLAYVARLVRSLGLTYGVQTDFGADQ